MRAPAHASLHAQARAQIVEQQEQRTATATMPTSGASQNAGERHRIAGESADHDHDDAIVEQQREHRERLLPHRKEAQARTKAQHDEDQHAQPQRLLAEQLAAEHVAGKAEQNARPRPTRSGVSSAQ